MTKYIQWTIGTDEGKPIYEAFHIENNNYLGYLHLRNWGRHIHWTWTQEVNIDMSPGCLEEVRQKMKELFNKRSEKK